MNFFDILYPPRCVNCNRIGEYVCANCAVFISEVPPVCPGCGALREGGRRHSYCRKKTNLNGLTSLWEYDGVVEELIAAIKYKKVFDIVGWVFRISDFGFRNLPPSVVITFIPMTKKKLKERGFNQAEIIAKELGKATGLPVMPLLKKTKNTKPQMQLSRQERLKNLKGTFQVLNPKHEARNSKQALNHNDKNSKLFRKLEFRNWNLFRISDFGFRILPPTVVLVDDVWTTGATMEECAKVLKASGVRKVWGFTLARGT